MAINIESRCGSTGYGDVARANFIEIATRLAILEAALAVVTTVRTITASDSIVATDRTVFIDATTDNVTGTLPTAVGIAGCTFEIKCINASGGKATVASAGGNVEGSATYVMAYRESVTVRSDGTNWWIVGGYVG